jgi:hypothetical protein
MTTKASPEHAGRGEIRLLVALILTACRFLAVYWSLQALADAPSMRLTWRAVIGLVSAVLFATLVRIHEARVHAGGKRGFVRLDGVLMALLLIANAFLGPTIPLWVFAVVLVGVAASCRWLLRPAMETHPLIGLAVHAPIRILSIAYPLALFGADFGFEQLVPEGLLMVTGVWMADAARDSASVARDSAGRARAAAALCGLLALIGAAGMVLMHRSMGLGWPYPVVVGMATFVLVAACLRLLTAPTAAPTMVRTASELYRIALLVGLTTALAGTFGVSWMEGEPWYTF